MTTYTTHTTIAEAADALRQVATQQGAAFLFAGSTPPTNTQKLIILDLVDATDVADFEAQGDVTRLQVNTTGKLLSEAVQLADVVRDRMQGLGFVRRPLRRLPRAAGETLNGVSADYVR